MNSQEERKLRDEIDYWSKHQELDKFNYNQSIVFFLGGIAVLLGILSLTPKKIMGILILLTLLIIITVTYYRIRNTDIHFTIRDKMIEERYCKLYKLNKGKFKEGLNEDFNQNYKKLRIKLKFETLLIFLIFIEILNFVVFLYLLK